VFSTERHFAEEIHVL